MKRLLLLRHAKASRDAPGIDDADRTLTGRGREDASRVGRYLRDELYTPDLVLCSTSARTRETLEMLLAELRAEPVVHFAAELYLAGAKTILEAIRRAPEAAASLMIIGHNPGLETCALELVAISDERKARKRYLAMSEKFPTAALAIIDFPVAHWRELRPGTGELELYLRAKELRDD